MNMTALLNRARKEYKDAQKKATADESAAKLAWQVARTAKIKLKQARKLSKLAKKSARKAEDKAEQSIEVCERAQAKLEKLQKRADKERRKNKPNQAARKVRRPRIAKRPSKPVLVAKRKAVKASLAGPAKSSAVLKTPGPAIPPQKITPGIAAKTPRTLIQKPQVAEASNRGSITASEIPRVTPPAESVPDEPKTVEPAPISDEHYGGN